MLLKTFFVGIFANKYLLGDLNDEFDRLVPISLLYDKTSNDVASTTSKIKQFYFNNEPVDETSESKVIDVCFHSILQFNCFKNDYF